MNLGLNFENTEEVIAKIEKIKTRFNDSMLKLDSDFLTTGDTISLQWFRELTEQWKRDGHNYVETAKNGMDAMVNDVKRVVETSKEMSQL